MSPQVHHTQCPHGGYQERIDMTTEPWVTLAPKCWNYPSAYRLGAEAEKHGIKENPFRGPYAAGVFDAGRNHIRRIGLSNTESIDRGAARAAQEGKR